MLTIRMKRKLEMISVGSALWEDKVALEQVILNIVARDFRSQHGIISEHTDIVCIPTGYHDAGLWLTVFYDFQPLDGESDFSGDQALETVTVKVVAQ